MIGIIGAGPVGCYTASLLAQAGHDVTVFEEHSSIGKPVQCTGIVTSSLDMPLPSRVVLKQLKKINLFGPSSFACVPVDDTVIDRTKFDCWLGSRAEKEGARFELSSRVVGVRKSGSGGSLKLKSGVVVSCSHIIGADGPNSIVTRYLGNKLNHYVGVQGVVSLDVDPSAYSVYLGSEFPGFFGWVVPAGDKVRVGIASRSSPRAVFDRFVSRFSKCELLEMQGGLIPVYDRNIVLQKGAFSVVGDAAGQVKATTGGGLVPGLLCAEGLAKSICTGKSYASSVSSVHRGLWFGGFMRSVLDRFTDADWDKLVRVIKRPSVVSSLGKYDRDSPLRLVGSILLRNPSLLGFGKVLLR